MLTAIYFVSLTVLFRPGYLDIFTPSHSDLYRYYVISQERWVTSSWLYPRPLMIAYLSLVGIFGNYKVVFLAIAIPSIIFMALVVRTVKKIGLVENGPLPIAAFMLVGFGSPMFYPHFQLDYGGMLGGVFAVSAIALGWSAITNNDSQTEFWWFLPLFFAMLSVEAKPNYAFGLLYLSFISIVIANGSRPKWLTAGILFILGWVFLKDKLIRFAICFRCQY